MPAEPTTQSAAWKQRLYDHYVSSGQAGAFAANAEQTFRPRAAYLRNLIAKHAPPNRSARILDIGCGHGALLYFLAQARYVNATGVDTSAEQIEMAHALGITNARCERGFEYVHNLNSDSLDMVILFDVLEHLERQELFEMLDEVHRILRPGGTCLIHVPNGEGIFGMRIRFGDLTHVQALTQNSARQLLSTTGFEQIACFEERPVCHGLKSVLRRLLWDVLTLPIRLLAAAETGTAQAILSENLLVRAVKKPTP